MSRLPNVSKTDIPEELHYVWDRLAPTPEAVPNIFRVMGNNPKVLRSYLRLGNGLWAACGLDVKTRELAILRTAILHHSIYEWHQHVRIGRAAGLSDEQIVALHHWRGSELFSPAERAMLAYVDAVAATEHPSQEIHEELAKYWPNSAIVGINLLAGYYEMTAKFLGAMEVEPEEPFVGWQLQGGA
ncbi:MAG: carboxymuconolactone decarboxylase family protein [Dehalococcoidia bacterium]|nr:carboxymuconolactone decarboxylase family protein [Dehalococcoidia bacterium]